MSGEHERQDGPERQAAVRAAGGLTEALTAMTNQLAAVDKGSQQRDAALKRSGHTTRILVIAAIAGFMLDVAATAIALVAIHGEHVAQVVTQRNSATISQLHAVNVNSCRTGNDYRQQEAQLWHYVISLVKPPPNATEDQRKATEQVVSGLQMHVRKATTPRNCAVLYRIH